MRDVPLALLLQDVFGRLAKGIPRLVDPWNSLVDPQALLGPARARAAFLVRWFGPFLPWTAFTSASAREPVGAARSLSPRARRHRHAYSERGTQPARAAGRHDRHAARVGHRGAERQHPDFFIRIQQKVLHGASPRSRS